MHKYKFSLEGAPLSLNQRQETSVILDLARNCHCQLPNVVVGYLRRAFFSLVSRTVNWKPVQIQNEFSPLYLFEIF